MIWPGACRFRDATDQAADRDLNARPDATAGHRLVIEARDDMQVGVEPAGSVTRACSRFPDHPARGQGLGRR